MTSLPILQEAAPHLQEGSSVVIISSIAGFHPQTSMLMYGVTKTALLGLTKVGLRVLFNCCQLFVSRILQISLPECIFRLLRRRWPLILV